VTDLVLVTGHDMGDRDAETPLLVEALADRGVTAAVEPWGDGDWAAGRLVVIRTPWDYTSRYEEFVEWVRTAGLQRPMLNPAQVILWNSHKGYLLELADAGIAIVTTALVRRGDRSNRAWFSPYDGEVVIKPAVSVGAYDTLRADPASAEAAAYLEQLLQSGDVLIQPYLPEIEAGEVSLIYFGGTFSHAVRKTPADGDFRVQVMYGGSNAAYQPTAAERALGDAAVAAVPQSLAYARADLLTTAAGPLLMELELIEPQLFLEFDGAAPARYADVLVTALSTVQS
jgi:glutathione synthase/RimK-type ligase-like ATP-grasp enzyme